MIKGRVDNAHKAKRVPGLCALTAVAVSQMGLGCAAGESGDRAVVQPVVVGDAGRTSTPDGDGRSADGALSTEAVREQIVQRHRHETGGAVGRTFGASSNEEFRTYADTLLSSGDRRWLVEGTDTALLAPSVATSLDRLSRHGLGAIQVTWSVAYHSPNSIRALGFVERTSTPTQLWEHFLDTHYGDLQGLWGLASRDDLRVTETRPVGEEHVVLRGARLRDGLPVEGQYFEVLVTTATSPLGPGVITRINAGWHRSVGSLSYRDRTELLDERRARELAVQRAGALETTPPDGAALSLSCNETCVPRWRVEWRSGRTIILDGLTGTVQSEEVRPMNLGPLKLAGLRPGDTQRQPIRFRAANIVDSSGVRQGETSWETGEHSLTTSSTLQIGFQGPVGASNAEARGRVFREMQVPGGWSPVPLYRNWTPSTESARDFSSPEAWAPSMANNYPNATRLVYGWLTYFQYVIDWHVGSEIVDRVSYIINPGAIAGIVAGQSTTGNQAPDVNGHNTWASMGIGVGPNDDVGSTFATDGDAMWSTAHEFGHTVNECAGFPGDGCGRIDPSTLPAGDPGRGTPSTWRHAVWNSHLETVPNAVADILTQFRYANARTGQGVVYLPDWTYADYASTTDSFGSESQGAAGPVDCLALGASCPSGFVCVMTTGHPVRSNGGICLPQCVNDSQCGSAMYCTSGLPNAGSSNACWYNPPRNMFWQNVSARVALTVDWKNSLGALLYGVGGTSSNGLRDLVVGSDSWYGRMLQYTSMRYEMTRAVQSVYSGTGFVAGDDFPDRFHRATPMSPRTTTGDKVWWGNGVYQYPRFEDAQDEDFVLFRGEQGQSFRVTSSFRGRVGAPWVDIYQISGLGGATWVNGGTSGSVSTGSLSSTGWYAAVFYGGLTSDWEGKVELDSGSDEIGDTIEEAYPMPHGVLLSAAGQGSSDLDAFSIHVPSSSTSLAIDVNANTMVYVFTPSGSLYGTYSVTTSSPTISISSVGTAGHWTWIVNAQAAGSYSTQALLGCASSNCDVSRAALSARRSWGDRFDGRLPTGTSEQRFNINLAQSQGVSVAVTDMSSSCRVEIDVFGPTDLRHFQNQRMLRWQDGAHGGQSSNDASSAGGYVEAIVPGTYEFVVRPASGYTCPHYRFVMARTGRTGNQWPEW